MTISSSTRKAGPFTGTGAVTTFPFTFKVFQASDLLVVRLNSSTSIESTLVLNTDYTVSLNQNQNTNPGGSVVLGSALASGYTLTITSDIGNLQPTDLTNQGGFYPTVINDALDRATIQVQQLAERADRSLTLALSTPSGVSATLPAPEANQLICWNETATGLSNVSASAVASIVAYGTANTDLFTGTGSATAFALSANPGSLNNLRVSINGLAMTPGVDFTWSSGTTITFTTAPSLNDDIVVQYMQALSMGTGDAANIQYTPAGSGVVPTPVQTKLREFVSAKDYGAVGGSDDTTAIQNAINQASLIGGEVRCETGLTYTVSTLTAKSNVVLNLNGSTLKLKTGTNERIFIGATGVNFAVLNGTLDGNQANNAGNYNLSGMSSFADWDGLIFKNVTWQNVYRTSLSITGTTKNVVLENIKHVNCGQANAYGMFAYGLECWPGTSRISIRNFSVSNHYGYGIHFYGCTDFAVDDANFDTLNFGSSSIAITLTQAARGRISNFNCSGVTGDNLEINACTDVVVENVNIATAGRYPLIMGDNGTGIWNERVVVRNFKCTSTGGGYSLTLNYIKRCRFEFFDCDKALNTTASGNPANDRNNVFEDCVFAANISVFFTFYRKFHLKRVSFLNYYVHDHDGAASTFSCPQTAGFFQISVANGASTNVSLSGFNSLGGAGFVCGRLRVTSNFNNQQGSYHEVLFLASNNNTTLNLSTVTRVDNSVARALTITADAANNQIVLTNSTGVTLNVFWTVELHKADY